MEKPFNGFTIKRFKILKPNHQPANFDEGMGGVGGNAGNVNLDHVKQVESPTERKEEPKLTEAQERLNEAKKFVNQMIKETRKFGFNSDKVSQTIILALNNDPNITKEFMNFFLYLDFSEESDSRLREIVKTILNSFLKPLAYSTLMINDDIAKIGNELIEENKNEGVARYEYDEDED